jgi:hypothetical protein
MHRIVLIKIAGKQVHLLKLAGAFIVFWAALMLLSSVFQMFWVAQVVASANAGNTESVTVDLNGMSVSKPITAGDSSTETGLLLPPIASIMFWSAIVLLGGMVYKMGGIAFPIDERVQDIIDRPSKKNRKWA